VATFHHHPDGMIYIRDAVLAYCDSISNLETDSGRPYAGLPDGFVERYYDPGRVHYFSTGRDQKNLGVSWEVGDTYIAELDVLLAAQQSRRNPPPTLDQFKNIKLAELNDAAARAYVKGFYSSASGTASWYDSDKETQDVITRQYLIALSSPETYASTQFFQGAPRGTTPVRARPKDNDPESAKTIQFLDAAQILKLGNDMAGAWASVKAVLWSLQARAYAATTAADLAVINWPTNI
jgi:hypothetical protein